MNRVRLWQRRRLIFVVVCLFALFAGLTGQLTRIMLWQGDYYSSKARDVHERERAIKAARGRILDRNGVILADNRTVCTVSVIHSQITDPEGVIDTLSRMLSMTEEKVRKAVEKKSSREILRTNVDKEVGDAIRKLRMDGVKVDEDFRRYYPFGTLASKVLGFTGSDNQGIIGLEVQYEELLHGTPGRILTLTDAKGVELEGAAERREEPIPGNDLTISLDYNIQMYAAQAAATVREKKQAKQVCLLVMDPDTGELLAMVNEPEFDLNDPFTLPEELAAQVLTEQERQDQLNGMWRNSCINDTYEPGSTFKIITMAAAMEEGVVDLTDSFYCPGYRLVEDRRIRCHKTTGHGSETFVEGAMNSCNPVFMELGLRLGVERYCQCFDEFGLRQKTGIDVPGEAATIMHQPENMGEVELATVSFGQSFQITPIQLLTTAAALINGGLRVTPHFAISAENPQGEKLKNFTYDTEDNIISKETSEKLRMILEKVVSEGTGKRAYLEGFSIGGKTATSEKLPRRTGRYISSFLGFAPAEDPQVIALVTIDEPEGIYYGGTIAAPVIADLFANILPYLGIEPDAKTTEEER